MQLPGYLKPTRKRLTLTLIGFFVLASLGGFGWYSQSTVLVAGQTDLRKQLESVTSELTSLKTVDQYQKNKLLEEEIKQINEGYLQAASIYEDLQDLKIKNVKTDKLDILYASAVKQLADKNYSSASATLADLEKQIKTESDKLAAANIPKATTTTGTGTSAGPTATTTSAPTGGYSVVSVQTDSGVFNIAVVAADLNSTRVIVDTASAGDCANDCPVLSLGEYVSRNGAFAGMNGSFFCPASYPSCAGKTNSFDTLLMNKNKTYFNSANNVYSTVPAVIFSGNSARFVSRSLEWGRDTGVDAVIANYPLYVHGGNAVDFSTSDAKLTSKGAKSFIGNKGSTVYIGFVYNASNSDAAKALKAMGLENALGMDQGGSSALWYGGYKVGPGRGIPNAILFVRK